jgi:hypothetical protein
MDVFVIPVSSDRYELYCEPAVVADAGVHPDPDVDAQASRLARWRRRLSPTLLLARWRRRLSRMLIAVEHRQAQPAGDRDGSAGWMSRIQDRMMQWVAERMAEQRLLWNLRGQTAVVAVHPQDMTFEQVRTLVDRALQRDYERHRLWLIIDTVLMILSWPLVFVPGPNLLLYFFMLRVGGHWFSMLGARQGLRHVTWTGRPCPPLSELRDVAGLDPAARERRVHEIAARLRLQHFSAFFARVA